MKPVLDSVQAERNRQEKSLSSAVAASLKRQMIMLKTEAAQFDRVIDRHVIEHPPLQESVCLLRSIDGVGRLVVVTILAEVPEFSAIECAHDVAAFAGLTPRLAKNGISVRCRCRMSREGRALLRKMLYMAAQQALKRHTKPSTAFVECGKAKMRALGAIIL